MSEQSETAAGAPRKKTGGRPKKPATMDCGRAMDIAGVSAMHAQLSKALAEHRPVVVRAGQVEQLSTAALQLMSAFMRDAEQAGVEVKWDGVSDEVAQAASTLGLASRLNLP